MGNSSDIILLNIKMGSQKYGEPVDDIMFSAHQMRSQSNTMGEKISHYVSDSPVSVVGCQLQVRVKVWKE